MPRLSNYNSKYHDDWAWSLAIRGATNQEIADAFDISRRTLTRWLDSFQSLKDAVSEGKEIADAKVERSLYMRAIGMETTDDEKIVELDSSGNPKPIKVKTNKKQLPPDTMAIMYWLNNRKRGQWSQRQEVQLEASNDSDTDVVIVLPHNNRQEHIEGTVEINAEE